MLVKAPEKVISVCSRIYTLLSCTRSAPPSPLAALPVGPPPVGAGGILDIAGRLLAAAADAERVRAENARLREENEGMRAEISHLKGKYEQFALDKAEMDELRQQRDDVMKENARLQEENTKLKAEVAALRAQVALLESDVLVLKAFKTTVTSDRDVRECSRALENEMLKAVLKAGGRSADSWGSLGAFINTLGQSSAKRYNEAAAVHHAASATLGWYDDLLELKGVLDGCKVPGDTFAHPSDDLSATTLDFVLSRVTKLSSITAKGAFETWAKAIIPASPAAAP
jgi:cell division protein FtsB